MTDCDRTEDLVVGKLREGAQASATIYSLAATVTTNGLNVEDYFTGLCKKKFLMH